MDSIEEHLKEYVKRGKADPRTTDELLEESLAAAAYKDSDDDILSDTYWEPVRILHCRADDSVFDAAKRLLSSASEEDRVLAANILAQVALGNETRRIEAADLLLPVFEHETCCEALRAMACAFGHIGDARSVPRLVELSVHPDESLRFDVAYGLSGQDDGSAIDALLALSRDVDDEVRDWATFALGTQTELDTPKLREGLVARLSDSDDETRHEAMVGLARRGDIRVIRAFLKELEFWSPDMVEEWPLITDVGNEVSRAAKVAADKRWRPLLERLLELEIGDQMEIQQAISACGSEH